MNNLGKRLRQVRGSTVRDQYARLLGVSLTTVANYETGKRLPGADYLKKVLDLHPQINPTWLLTGEGPMDRENERHQIDQENTCSCESEDRLKARAEILGKTSGGVDFDLLQHIIGEVADFRMSHQDALTEDEMREVTMIAYSFCQAGNRTTAGLICRIVEGWLEKKGEGKEGGV